MARIRTLNFLPEVFQTPSNAEFLAATLDQIVNPPNTTRIQGYVGSRVGYGVNANDFYVVEPTKERADYQLDPAVVFTKPNESVAKDFITYPGIVNALMMQGAATDDNNRLFQSQFYSWDSFCDLDKLNNYNQYYWLPDGPPAVTVGSATVFTNQSYVVTDLPNGYSISVAGSGVGTTNPTLTLLRGGTYTFSVNQESQFWIQGEPGVSGYSPTQPNQPVRDVYGVSNNGATSGFVTFTVPPKDAQNQYEFPNVTNVDVVSTTPFDDVNGKLLSEVGGIDGVTGLEGLRVIFYDTGIPNETGYISSYFGESGFDANNPILDPFIEVTELNIESSTHTLTDDYFTLGDGYTTDDFVANQTIIFNAAIGGVAAGQVYYVTNILNSTDFEISDTLNGDRLPVTSSSTPVTAIIGFGLYEEGFYTNVSENYYRITYVGATTDPMIRLIPDGAITQDTKIVPLLGTEFANRPLYQTDLNEIALIPYITAPLDTLYYQDGTTPNKVGIIKIIESNLTNTLNVDEQILGKKNFTSTNGVKFTNGLKIQFDGDVVPTKYLTGQYYVEGVGTGIELVPVSDLVSPEPFTQGEYNPWDILGWDIGNYDISLYVPVLPDYITIARNSINKNAWSRSNRWFHIDVINATAAYNNNPTIINLATGENKAKRPIIEFYPNIKMWNSGVIGKAPVDFIDTKNTDALSNVPGSLSYYPDIEVYTTATATIDGVTSDTSTTVTVPVSAVTGNIENYMYISDSMNILPNNSMITELSSDGTTYTMTVTWEDATTFAGDTNVELVASALTTDNYSLFSGARVIFAADSDENVRNKIYVADIEVVTAGESPVITLTVAEDGFVEYDSEVTITRGYSYQGYSFWYDAIEWIEAQQKNNVNQAPLFDLYDNNGISLGDNDYYQGTSFTGCTLFAYDRGTGENDPILGFPVKYSSVANVGDINFVVSLNADTFSYVLNGNPITENVNVGYVYNYSSPITYERCLGWETAIAPSAQYQIFSFEYDVNSEVNTLSCDIAALPDLQDGELGWPRVKVFYNNIYQEPGTDFTYTIGENTTTITLLKLPEINIPIEVFILSDQVSEVGYYSVPINLTNNPLNEPLTSVSLGNIRLQYQNIFINAPNTTGDIYGPNNYRDCGNLVPYGSEIIQNSASLVMPGAFLRTSNHSLFDALMFNSREYVKFKQLIVDTVQNTDYPQRYTPSTILDAALDQITAAKSQINAFFWSDMLPSKSPYISNTYVFNNDLDQTIYPLSKVYDFDTANYDGVLVYVYTTVDNVRVEKQLISGIEYTVSKDSPSLRINIPLQDGDNVVVKEYNQTYGSYVPNTPTKLGLYPAFEPAVVLDSDYMVPTYFIRGHDGSFTKLYGDYNPTFGILVDFRDQALLEFEKRVYNNLKLSEIVPIRDFQILPGYFRQNDSTYTYDEFLAMYSPSFLDWIGQNRIDYKTQYFTKVNEFTYNYTNSAEKLTNKPIQQGYWRGVYRYFYDTFSPNETPWEMLGFSIQPTWWTERYGPAPYTSDNLILWNDLEAGYIWNNGDPYIQPELARPGLSTIIPVDSNGNILSPFDSIVGNFNPNTFQKDWKVGDIAPAELSYQRSSTWPFDIIRLFALTRPAEFYNLAADLDNYKYNEEFNQYLVNNRSHLVVSDIEIYGNGTAKTSYINWIVDYEKQQGIDATANITTMLDNMDCRLAYRLAGYSDKTLLNFYVEKGSPTSLNSSLLIPDESYSVLLYENQPFNKIMFSGVIVQQNNGYWTVYGNSQNFAYFEILDPLYNGQFQELRVEKQKVKLTVGYEKTTTLIPYGTKFYSTQDLAQFLMCYGANLESKGMIFDEVENGVHVTWQQMVLEFLYWAQTGWSEGSILTLNPAAQNLDIDAPSSIVQPLTIQQQNFILNQNLYPIQVNDLCVNRDGTNFHVHTLNAGDTMAYAQFNMSNFEHGIVFDNTTLFNDTLYDKVTGLRQNRIFVRGVKTAEWNGTVSTWGFILNQDNVQEWNGNLKYTKGVIVKYKNKYWTSLDIVEPSKLFNELQWKEINYNDIQKGLLPNASTRAYESTLYYDAYEANLEQDADLLSYSLIGYRPRDYLALVDLTDTAQVQVYKNMIKNKGTKNAVDAFKGANLPQGGIQYDVYENWAIQSGSYGGILNENFVEFQVNQEYMTGDPSIVSLTNGVPTEGSMQEIPLWNLYNYSIAPTSPNILNTTTAIATNSLYPSAGYVNFDDVKMASYFYSGLPYAVDTFSKIVPIQNFYVGDHMWLANFKERWEVYRWKTIGEVIQVRSNRNNTATITFNVDHNLKRLDPVAIINFATNVDGYYLVAEVVSLREVIIDLSLVGGNENAIDGRGLGFRFESQRVATPSEIAALNLTSTEFVKNTVWVDENNDGSWAVYRKTINYQNQGDITVEDSVDLGAAVAYTDNGGYLVGDPGTGNVYRYDYNADTDSYSLNQPLSGDTSFGTAIAYASNIYAISQPTTNPTVKLYVRNDSVLTDNFTEYQPNNPIDAPGGVTDWGSSLAMSDDTNWLYISALDTAEIYVYRKEQITRNAGDLVPNETYVITSVGDTDWEAIGAEFFDGNVGYTFEATGAGSGTGVAMQVTYRFSNIIDGADLGLTPADNFGYSISTNTDGSKLIVGAPNVDYSGSIINWGKAYVYDRTVQNYEVQYNSVDYQAQSFNLAWTPINNFTRPSDEVLSGNRIKISSGTHLDAYIGYPVIFTGSDLGSTNIQTDKVYYIYDASATSTKWIQIAESRDAAAPVTLEIESGLSIEVNVQADPLYVTVNGVLVQDNNYAVIGNQFNYVNPLRAGDIINVSDNQFFMVQEFNSDYTNRTDIQYGISVDMNKFGSTLLVGSPFEIDNNNKEGAVYTYVDAGAKYGFVIGTNECSVTTNRTLLINGFAAYLSAGDATAVANQINQLKINNVMASATIDNKLMISLVDNALSPIEQKLVLTAFESDVLDELGLTLYVNTQTVKCPHDGPTQFGYNVKVNSENSMVVAAPSGIRFEGTVFDFTDDVNLTNDTIFDNNATQFIEQYQNAGAVYMFDYLANYEESLTNPGAFVYAQSVNDDALDYGFNPEYGYALDFNENTVIIGSPNFQPALIGGKAVVYKNQVGLPDWYEFRQSAPVVDIEKIQNIQLYDATTNNTLVNFDYPDPLQNKLLGIARENLDYVSGVDPANYNVNYTPQTGMIWGADHIGKMWFNTNNVRWMNYHQNNVVYNSRYWGEVFPGSDVAVYTWIASFIPPVNYQGPGVPYDVNQYVVSSTINSSNVVVPIYYFWVRNTNIIFEQIGKTLSDTIVAAYIASPRTSGISYVAPLLPNTFAMYNSGQFFNANSSVFHIGYANGTSNDVSHSEYTLIRTDYSDDFLPGLPNYVDLHTKTGMRGDVSQQYIYGEPYSLYAKLLDSLSGCDVSGQVVPNPLLPPAVRQGVLDIPRQSFFYDRYLALNNYLSYANEIMAQYPIVELKGDLSFLFKSGEFYDTANYWEYINWWVIGYDNNTKTSIQVPVYGDLAALDVPVDTLVKVERNGAGKFEVYRYDGNGVWTRVGLENGTIQFKTFLWDYSAGKLGWSGNFFDTDPYDAYPSEETRNIIRALNEQIYTDELLIYRNKSLILLFEFIQAETIESQNYLPWLNKTSLADVSHTIRELKPYEVYKTDNQVFLSEYINEVKPYHVVIKDFLFKYTGTDVYEGDITDFDVPATYNATYKEFISPQLVYTTGTNNQYEYTLNSDIWQTAPYTQWFQNYGLSMGDPIYQNGNIINYVGAPNYPITTLTSYVTRGTKTMFVDNASGFPVNGVVTIGKEKIGYSYVDRALNLLGGLVRGLEETTIEDHLPGEQLFIDLPAILLLSGGRGYENPPKVTAVIDTTIYPEPIEEATFEAVMSLDSVLEIIVTNPGKGYAVQPEIVIDPAVTITYDNTDIVSAFNTLRVYAPNLRTGDLVQYKTGTGAGTGRLVNGEWYYVNVLENSPSTIVALYSSYRDAVNDQHRIPITDIGTSIGMTLNLGAKAIAITQSSPTRENKIRLKFDRTTYNSQILDWEAGTFYGAYFAGSYYNTDKLSSTNITLESTTPNINTLLASGHQVPFEVVDVENERQLTWSSFVRTVASTNGTNDSIRLLPLDGNNAPLTPEDNASGTTLGFYVGMPIKFGGTAVGGLAVDVTYYVSEIVNDIDFKVSTTVDGPSVNLSTATASIAMYCFTGQVVDQAVLTVNYPGIMETTATSATNNAVTIPLTDIGTGGTNGFYPGIILFFTATNPDQAEFGNLIENQVYYVNTIIDEQTFTISETNTSVTTNIDNEVFTTPQEIVIYNTTVTETDSATDIVTVESTEEFAVNDRVIFNQMIIAGSSSDTFGNIVSGQVYYVSQVVSDTEMKISEAVNGTVFALSTVTSASDTSAVATNQKNTVTLKTATGSMTANVSLPVSPGQVNGQKFTMYQTSGQYTGITTTTVTDLLVRAARASIGTNYSIAVNRLAVDDTTWFYTGMPFALQDDIGAGTYMASISGTTMTVTSIITGAVYPGQEITGSGVTPGTTIISQLTGSPGETGTYQVSISQTITPAVTITNVPCLSLGTTYYVKDYSGMPDPLNEGEFLKNIYVVADATTAGTQGVPGTSRITCNSSYDTSSLYVGMGITFSGVGLGGLEIGQEYFVSTIVNSTQFTVSEVPFGTEFRTNADSGTMAGTGSPWITVSSTPGGSVISLVNEVPTSTIELDQVITAYPVFTLSYLLGGYSAIITDGGTGFAITNTITIPGTEVGGLSPANDVTLQVNTIDEAADGAITSLIITGTPPGITRDYYFKIRGANQFEVYENSLMTIPASGLTIPYTGFTTTAATAVTASNDRITVADSSVFDLNDPVVFTGDIFTTDITLGQTYYIKSIPSSTAITISTAPQGATLNITSNQSGTMTVAKAGSFAFLSEPFYFSPSIIRFNNRLYTCLVSNNDAEFVIGKWELIDSGDRRINAMDRVIGYYQPTVNMPGVDLTQLFEGVTFPYTTYQGNAFEPSLQFDLDVNLKDQAFYPTGVQLNAIVYNNGYYAAGNLADYSSLVYSLDTENWLAAKLASQNINLTDIAYANGTYVITSTNTATPIFRSSNGTDWSTNGYFTPWGVGGWSANNYDMTSLEVSKLALQSVAYFNGWIAVGDNIIFSDDTYHWAEVKTYETGRGIELYGVSAIETQDFNGAVAVGKSSILAYENGLPILKPVNLITYTTNGTGWTDVDPVTNKTFYTIATDGEVMIAAGESGVMYYSYNAADWFGLNEASVISFSSSNYIISVSPNGFQVGDAIKFNKSFSTVTAGTTYYVESVISSTLLTISDTPGGSAKVLTPYILPEELIMYSYNSIDIRDLTYNNGIWVAVGDAGYISTSSDGVTWTTQTSGTTNDLNGITYVADDEAFVVVGDDNTIIKSVDQGVTWENVSLFEVLPATHNVKGAPFPYGYGPEELVPGLVRDNLAMTVTTRPGTNWSATEYAHTGYRVITLEIPSTGESQTEYSFYVEGVAETEYPAQIFVQVLDAETKLGTTLYEGIDYTVNWLTKQVILNTPLSIIPRQLLRIDVYEVGNGDQLVKSNTDVDPIRLNSVSGFNEIYLNCNYSATIFQGSGVIRPGTFDSSIIATSTEAVTNRITVADVNVLSLGDSITFSGDILGGLEPNLTYYVKSISYATSSITVSNYFDPVTGVAGATIPVTTDAGIMYVNLSIGSDTTWTAPIVYNNGVKLVQGYSSQITQTIAGTNAIVTNSTAGMVAGCKIAFSNDIFGGVIQPVTTYYVKEVLNSYSFTIADEDGNTIVLTDALGGSTYITYDYAFGIQPNGTAAKMIFPTDSYSNDTNYIVYSIFGETTPEQYGFTIPETQLITSTGGTSYPLNNDVGEANAENAVVEIDGLRLTSSEYEIDFDLNYLNLFFNPTVGSIIAVTTYNDTRRQYFNTQYGVSGASSTGSVTLTVGTTSRTVGLYDEDAPDIETYDQNTPTIVSYDELLDWLTLSSGDTADLAIGDPIVFDAPTIGGLVAGRTYYVTEIWNSTEFVISTTPGGLPVTLTNDTGAMTANTNPLVVSAIQNVNNVISPALAVTIATDTNVSGEITVLSTDNFIEGQTVEFRGDPDGFGGVYNGLVYFVDTIVDSTTFTIKDYYGDPIPLTTDSGEMVVTVGGNSTVTVTTATEAGFNLNTLVRIDGIEGSTQLNNNTYYARPVSPFTYELYQQPYNSTFNGVNYPVTNVSSYISGGYIWPQGVLYLVTTNGVATTEPDIIIDEPSIIEVISTASLVEGTPVYFSKPGEENGANILGGLIQGTEYYVKEIFDETHFNISATRNGEAVVLTDATGYVNVTQWNQTNVDRLWVTINGYRVPSSNLRLNDFNELSILAPIVSGDEVVITSMIPSATPNQEVYLNFVDDNGIPSVYRTPADTRTWITENIYPLSSQISVNNVNTLVNLVEQNVTTPVEVSGKYTIGLTSDKRTLSSVIVVNNTLGITIDPANYATSLNLASPVLIINAGAWINEDDELIITSIEGNTVYINGEQIGFGSVDFENNILLDIRRGINGTAQQYLIPEYTAATGLLSSNRLSEIEYNQTWNSYVYNTEQGDPLQISETTAANFLNTDQD